MNGLTPTVIPATSYADLHGETLRAKATEARRPEHYPQLEAVEFAITMSHRQVYDYVLANSMPCALIFEDDIALHPTFSERLTAADFPADGTWDLIKFDYWEGEGDDYYFEDRDGPLQLVRNDTKHTGSAGCYAVSLEGARYLRDMHTPIYMTADGALNPGPWQRHRELTGLSSSTLPLRPLYAAPLLAWQQYNNAAPSVHWCVYEPSRPGCEDLLAA